MTKFESLSIINCGLKSLPPIFDDMHRLGEITLVGNPITDLADSVFPQNYTSVYRLAIQNSLLERVPPVLSHLTRLDDIYLTDNKIHAIGETDFHGMSELFNMYLSGNPLTNISDNALKNHRLMSTLFLDNKNDNNSKSHP